MRVLLLGFTKIAYMPYIHFYLEQLRTSGYETHLLYWQRDNNPDSELSDDVVSHCFSRYQEDSVPLVFKMSNFRRYRRTALDLMKTHEFDLIIVLHSTPGVLLYDKLVLNYRGNYILDYRDLTYENFWLYNKVIHSLVNNSAATFVSSDAYRPFLPDSSKIYTSHNITKESLAVRDFRKSEPRIVKPIRIRFWGLVRHVDINIAIIEKLANDSRYELHYHGRLQKAGLLLQKHCSDNGFSNVFFHGEYLPHDRFKFAARTDLIHNIYANDGKTTYAMGNKYYDGIALYLPQLCSIGSFMGRLVQEKGVGLAVDPNNEDLPDMVFAYYQSLNWMEFEANCDRALNDVMAQYSDGAEVIKRISKQKRDDKGV